MSKISVFFLSTLCLCAGCNLNQIESQPAQVPTDASQAPASLYDEGIELNSLAATEIVDLSAFGGKKLLLVNVASECGFTSQYADLQTLHEKHGDQVTILGLPCNEFGGQEPGTQEEIARFCQANYGVSFQMAEKVSVKKGSQQHPLYQWLTNPAKNGWNDQAPSWNFCKYLINERGELEKFFASGVKPMGPEILEAIGLPASP